MRIHEKQIDGNGKRETIHVLASRNGKFTETIAAEQAQRWVSAGFIEEMDDTDHIKTYQLAPGLDRAGM